MPEADNSFTDDQNLQEKQPTDASKEPRQLRSGVSGSLQAKLMELAHDAILIRNVHSQIVVWNQGAQSLYGWTEEETRGQVTHQLLQTRFPVSKEAVDQALAQEDSWEGLLQHTTRQGRQVIVESRQVLLRDEAGRPSAILEINRDVTQRELLLQERAQARAQELALQETIQQMDAFLSLASHELRTPVTSLKSMVQLMHRQADRLAREANESAALAQRQGDLLERAERQINRLTRLLDDLLDLSRIREGRLEFRPEPGNLRVWVQDAIESEAVSHPERSIVFEAGADEPVPVLADADRIGQVITNYLTNALKYSPAGKPIHVRLLRLATQARVEVADEGPGIPVHEQAHVWELFHRVPGIEVVSGSGVGLGLGLYLCKSLIERHGGQVGVESSPGHGACFWFTLPLLAEQGT